MPVRPLCHGAWKLVVVVPLPAAQRVDQVGVDVRHVRDLSSGWIQPRLDHPGGHPVGQHHHVALDRLAGAELVADLGEELGVVVDVVGVLDGDPGCFLEVLQRVRLALRARVDVRRPVADDQRACRSRRRLRRSTSPGPAGRPRSRRTAAQRRGAPTQEADHPAPLSTVRRDIVGGASTVCPGVRRTCHATTPLDPPSAARIAVTRGLRTRNRHMSEVQTTETDGIVP